MIPILYDNSEMVFESNGLCRLRDCITCTVTEERNGIYECDFTYPVTGANFDSIIPGRIIAVTHDETGDTQPFDIVSYTKPIDGIVTFHAVHISYRQSYLTISGTNINSLADAFTLLYSAEPNNPFRYRAYFPSTAYMAAADGVPRSVRQMLGGVEGSILDTYGGEYEWDKFTVKLHSARGVKRDLTVRYGVNMSQYKDDTDYSGTYSAVVPYWNGSDGLVVGNRVDSGFITYNGWNTCVPLDLTEKFETKPTTAQLETLALSYMQSQRTNLPQQTIDVDFIRLQDYEDYAGFADLLRCNLCDSIDVAFPRYGMSGTFKIVKTEWNVLLDRYNSMQLGSLSTTLAEALGISSASDKSTNVLPILQGTGNGATISLSSNTITQVPITATNLSAGDGLSITGGGIAVSKSGIYTISAGAYISRVAANRAVDVFIKGGTSYATSTELIAANEICHEGNAAAPATRLFAQKTVSIAAGTNIYLAVRSMASTGSCYSNNSATFLQVEKIR